MIERTYIVPLRKEFQKVPAYKRAKKAVVGLRRFLKKHMKSDDVLIGRYANEYLWSRGIKNPPHKIEVKVVKHDDNKVVAELVGKPMPSLEKKEKEADKSKIEQAVEKLTGGKKKPKPAKKEEKEAEVVKETPAPKPAAEKPALPQEAPTPQAKEPVKQEEKPAEKAPAPEQKKVTEDVKPLPEKK